MSLGHLLAKPYFNARLSISKHNITLYFLEIERISSRKKVRGIVWNEINKEKKRSNFHKYVIKWKYYTKFLNKSNLYHRSAHCNLLTDSQIALYKNIKLITYKNHRVQDAFIQWRQFKNTTKFSMSSIKKKILDRMKNQIMQLGITCVVSIIQCHITSWG